MRWLSMRNTCASRRMASSLRRRRRWSTSSKNLYIEVGNDGRPQRAASTVVDEFGTNCRGGKPWTPVVHIHGAAGCNKPFRIINCAITRSSLRSKRSANAFVRLKSAFANAATPLSILEHEKIEWHCAWLVQNDLTLSHR